MEYKHSEIGADRVKETGLWFVRSDVTGIRPPGQYGVERIAYGPTQVMNPKAEVVAQVPLRTVGLITVDIPVPFYGLKAMSLSEASGFITTKKKTVMKLRELWSLRGLRAKATEKNY